ncbi:LysM domain-containing protein [Metarhizium rileyi]|uniref:LysM domain-containing protein n=1 Tax=Metarhizium rileyi (strain RCEF 4871) TaxID=1649241 RepID=A0A167G2A5_METRR|nr:LysM domain-containing protein [Metarhizium rileyi RCEF 4871]
MLSFFFGLAAMVAGHPFSSNGTLHTLGYGHEHHENTRISLINATPYQWHKTYNHSYQLSQWEAQWPQYIQPGQVVTVAVKGCGYCFVPADTAGQVTYRIEDTEKPMSLQVQHRAGRVHWGYVQFLENMETLNNGIHSELNLGTSRSLSSVAFVLAGTEGDFISNDGPTDWMQHQLEEIGHLPLRNIAMPRSHNSGQWKSEVALGLARAGNTQTQTLTLLDQLGTGGIRVLDLRLLLKHGRFHAHHGAVFGRQFNGMLGASLKEMIDMQNQFMEQHPGELFIWDIHEGDGRNGDRKYEPFDDADRKLLYDELLRLNHRRALPKNEDLTLRPLNFFIDKDLGRRGRSCVVVRVPVSWAARAHFPGSTEGFVSGADFPLRSRWSDTNHVEKLVEDQLARMKEARPQRDAEVYNMEWVITQQGVQTVTASDIETIIELSGQAWRTMHHELWQSLTHLTYPNWITMDDIHGSSHKALVMAINKCLVARRCGRLGGKVADMVKHHAASYKNSTVGAVGMS